MVSADRNLAEAHPSAAREPSHSLTSSPPGMARIPTEPDFSPVSLVGFLSQRFCIRRGQRRGFTFGLPAHRSFGPREFTIALLQLFPFVASFDSAIQTSIAPGSQTRSRNVMGNIGQDSGRYGQSCASPVRRRRSMCSVPILMAKLEWPRVEGTTGNISGADQWQSHR
jgi:hypothetical protein